jgi:hypothetical protein
MNFIPFILIFIAAIGFVTSSLFEYEKSALKELFYFKKELAGSHLADTLLATEYFESLNGVIKEKRLKNYPNHRANTGYKERSKCNFLALFKDRESKEYFKKLLLNLYAPLFKDDDFLAENLIQTIEKRIKFLTEKKLDFSLLNLCPKDEGLKEVYLLMLKGTTAYQNTKSGYPPLEDFFTFDKESKGKPLCFHFAHEKLFSLALGAELSLKVIEKEKSCFKEHRRGLLVDEFKVILTEEGIDEKEQKALFHLFQFNALSKKRLNVVYIDPELQFEIRKHLNLSGAL